MLLSIIIVNYKSAALILDCLQALYQMPGQSTGAPGQLRGNPGQYPFEILVVDNASGDDSHARITAAFPEVTWISMDYNSGFARANNEGIRRCNGDTVLLLNGDTLPDAQTILTAYQRLSESAHIAAGVQLLNPDGTPQISGMYVMRGGLNYLLPLPYLGALIKMAGQKAKVKKPHVADAAAPVEVDWINGAFLMVKKKAIEKAGLLDEDFFLYAEEAEWCSRLKTAGSLILYGDLHVIHLQGETANQEFGSAGKGYYNLFDRKGLQIMLSNFVRIRKQFGIGWFLVQLFFYITDIPVFGVGLLVSRVTRKTPSPYSFPKFRAYCKNIGVIMRLSPIIIRNKPYFYKVL
jgi:GT2 family glycosyltransferase